MSRAAGTIQTQVCVSMFSFTLGKFLGVRLLGHLGAQCVIFEEPAPQLRQEFIYCLQLFVRPRVWNAREQRGHSHRGASHGPTSGDPDIHCHLYLAVGQSEDMRRFSSEPEKIKLAHSCISFPRQPKPRHQSLLPATGISGVRTSPNKAVLGFALSVFVPWDRQGRRKASDKTVFMSRNPQPPAPPGHPSRTLKANTWSHSCAVPQHYTQTLNIIL